MLADQHINGDCDPYLGLHRILGRTEKRFDAQMLFDLFEEQFHQPAVTIQVGLLSCRYGKVVGQGAECPASVIVVIFDAT